MLKELKSLCFPKGIQRFLQDRKNNIVRRVSSKQLLRDLESFGLRSGDLVCVHSALSNIGYIIGGGATVIKCLSELIGKTGTIMMPAFSSGNSTFEYINSNPSDFDTALTRVTTGRLAEVFRKSEGVTRSLHPTHSVAAKGPLAEELLADHEKSITPFGPDTPYSRLVAFNGKILLLNTNGNSVLHKVLEDVEWPNDYLDEIFELSVVVKGVKSIVKTRVHRPGASYVYLRGKNGCDLVKMHIPDFCLPYLHNDKIAFLFSQIDESIVKCILNRFNWFLENKIVYIGNIGYGKGAIIDSYRFTDRIKFDLNKYLDENR